MYFEDNERSPGSGSECPTEFVEMNFVSKLLLLALEKQPDEITIVPSEFVYGAGGTVKTTRMLKVQITTGEVTRTREQIEINLSGMVENDYGHNEIFALYLTLWPDSLVGHLLNKGISKAVELHTVEIECEHLAVYLPDSVFGLDLFQTDDSDQQITLGQGRGYLVFGEII